MAVFCGCLPLRAGALLLTVLQLIIGTLCLSPVLPARFLSSLNRTGAGTAVLLWWEILDGTHAATGLEDNAPAYPTSCSGSAPFTTLQKFALYASASVNMLLGLVAFFGSVHLPAFGDSG